MELNPCQTKALNEIIKFHEGTELFHVLTGVAGTGKTTLIKELRKHIPLTLTASTNKAADVLGKIVGTSASTVHSFLRRRPTYNGLSPEVDIERVEGILLVDEASLIGNIIFKALLKYAEKTKTKVLFCGDVSQLPPPREDLSPAFHQGFNTSTLKQIMRQAEGNLQTACKALQDNVMLDIEPNIIIDGVEILQLNKQDFFNAFETDVMKSTWENSDSKYLAWTNQATISVNNKILLKKRGDPLIREGDLLTNNSYACQQGIKMPTDAMVYIEKVKHNVIQLGVEGCNVVTMGLTWFVPYKHSIIKQLAEALEKERKYDEASVIKNTWLDLRSIYGLTIHKSQGSTFKRIFLDIPNINTSIRLDYNLFKKLLYVGASRASEQLIIRGS